MELFLATVDISTVDEFIVWSNDLSCELRNQFCTGKLLIEISTQVKRVFFWKYFAASRGNGICDGIRGSLKVRVAEHAKGKHRDNVMVQNYSDFYKFAKEYCPKITLFKLGKEEVETSTANGKPWDNVIAKSVLVLHSCCPALPTFQQKVNGCKTNQTDAVH